MPEYTGNAMPVPGFTAEITATDQEILASTAGFSQRGVTLLAGQGVLPAGCVIARQSATKKYVVYNNAGSGGAEIARGILRQTTDTTKGDTLGNMILTGTLKNNKISGADSAALTDLNARQDSVLNLFVI